MKYVLIALIFCIILNDSYSQEVKFRINGELKDRDGNPIENAFIVNFSDQIGTNSNKQGFFSILVNKGDSLMIVHLAFKRKKIYADSVSAFSEIVLETEVYEIGNTNVFSKLKDQPTELSESLDFEKHPIKLKYGVTDAEIRKMSSLVTQENKILRTEATSVRFLSFSPSFQFRKLKKHIKKQF